MYTILLRFARHFLRSTKIIMRSIIAPPFCRSCQKFLSDDHILCFSCRRLIEPVTSARISITPQRTMVVHAIGAYTYPLKKLVLAKRWSDAVSSTQLGTLMWQMTPLQTMNFDYIVPIPLYWTRHTLRGFNQSEHIAREISRLSGKPVVHLVRRTRATQFQAGLSRVERVHNVRHAFELINKEGDAFKDKHLLLVDDLMTTSATLFEVARALLPLRPSILSGVVACRAVH